MVTAPTITIEIQSGELANFNIALADAKTLLDIHDEQTNQSAGKPNSRLEVLKRSAVILSVTAWESFIEETIRASALERLKAAAGPADMQSTFNSVANAWLEVPIKNPQRLALWAADGWKDIIRLKIGEDIDALNTPNTKNIQKLSSRFLGLDVTAAWHWHNTTVEKAGVRLDDLIKLRGDLVHNSRKAFAEAAVRRVDVVAALALLPKLVKHTELALGREPVPVTI